MSKVQDKFIKYVKFDTRSNEESNTIPTTKGQFVLGKELVEELKNMGMDEAFMDENGYVMASLSSNTDKKVPSVGFISHMDTSPEISGTNVNPQFVENYDGKDIVLNAEKRVVLSPRDFPELKNYIGKTLITADGTTLLGADDKAGIAEIMTALETLIEHPEIKHGDVKAAFTPDEEIGRGSDYFDVKRFGADLAYTLDGGVIGELQYENFNAASAKVTIKGRSVHPGSAKGVMINSVLIAGEFMSMLPENETPATTEGYEGFYHLVTINGGVEETNLDYIIRDFDKDKFNDRKNFIVEVSNKLNKKYGDDTVLIEVKDQYKNMKEQVEPKKYIVDTAYHAMELVGVVPKTEPIRGGTDGASLSFKGLPTPNIFTGGHNFHGKFEYIPVCSMEKAVEVVLKIVELYEKI
ncbi:peptidase T [Clostridium fermenticellae]|uniref:Peptidase T n=1 Tax=Clostridium fermenticellae TaxID=2068654 RepID=A0A386H5I6_9CLOT|nr:peptidase T [Clostridium fermenticellae]AYD40874.1 peptidase T [Clostridium fermenticellae]